MWYKRAKDTLHLLESKRTVDLVALRGKTGGQETLLVLRFGGGRGMNWWGAANDNPEQQRAKHPYRSLLEAWDRYNGDGAEIQTPEDLADTVESLLEDDRAPAELDEAVRKFREDQTYDIEVKGRGEMDTAGEQLEIAVQKAAETIRQEMGGATPTPGGSGAEIDAGRFTGYTDREVGEMLDHAYMAGAPQGIIDMLETELDLREREEDDPSGGDDEPNRSNMGLGVEELMRQAALRGRNENMSPAQLGAEIRRDGDFAVMTGAIPLATVSDAELGQEAYDALQAHEDRISAIRRRMSTDAGRRPSTRAGEDT